MFWNATIIGCYRVSKIDTINTIRHKRISTTVNYVHKASHFTLKSGPVNSLRPSDAIWRHSSGSFLIQKMACCTKSVSGPNADESSLVKLCYSPEGSFTIIFQYIYSSFEFQDYQIKIANYRQGANELKKVPRASQYKAFSVLLGAGCRALYYYCNMTLS